MKTKYLDTEIERLSLLERIDELTDWGKEMLSELKEIKQALFIQRVSNRRKLFDDFYKWLDGLTQAEYDDMSLTDKIEKYFFKN